MAGGTGAFQSNNLNPGVLLDLLGFQNREQNLAAATPWVVGSTGTFYGQSFPLHRGMIFGWEFKVTSSGVVALTVELEQANQPPTLSSGIEPLTQDDAFGIPINKTGSNGLIPTGSIAAAGWFKTAYAPIATVLGRLKITGTGSNDASTAITIARVYQIKTV